MRLDLGFFKPVVDAVKGYLNFEELVRVVVAGVIAGGTVWSILELVHDKLGVVITDPNLLAAIEQLISQASARDWIGFGLGVATIVIEGVRRYRQGLDVKIVLDNPKLVKEQKKND